MIITFIIDAVEVPFWKYYIVDRPNTEKTNKLFYYHLRIYEKMKNKIDL